MCDAATTARTYYGKSTALAVRNFPACGRGLSEAHAFLANYARVKAAAAMANAELDALEPDVAEAIVAASAEIAAGELHDQFPIPLVQGGAGTSTNMAVNEVIAARAEELLAESGADVAVHPNDHVNRSQSTNDTYPTAVALTLLDAGDDALAALDVLIDSLLAAASRYRDVQRLGRTHLRDAVPLSAGDGHAAHAEAVRRTRSSLVFSLERFRTLPLGGTVLGSGIGAPEGYAALAVERLGELTGRELEPAGNLYDAMANADPYVLLAGSCTSTALAMAKVANDLRFLSSGPRSGICELELPELQPGSSIMPGKVNPVIPEYVLQLSFRVRGCAHTVEAAVAAGELELNVMKPVIFDALLTALGDLRVAALAFAEKCIDGVTWREEVLAEHSAASVGRFVELATQAGYDEATQAARQAG